MQEQSSLALIYPKWETLAFPEYNYLSTVCVFVAFLAGAFKHASSKSYIRTTSEAKCGKEYNS